MTALELSDLRKAFGGVKAVNGVSLDVAHGSLTALIGPNGAGKSTLFNLLTNLYPSDAGSVTFFRRALVRETSDAIARLGLVRTFQTARVFPGMSVRENVLAGWHVETHVAPWAHALRLGNARREEH